MASGPIGGVHEEYRPAAPRVGGYAPAAVRGPEVGRPLGGEVARPGGEFRPGGVLIGGDRGAGVAENRAGVGGTVIRPGGDAEAGGRTGHSTTFTRHSNLNAFADRIRGRNYPYFNGGWFHNHGGAWYPGAWYGGLGLWDVPLWDSLAPWVGIDGPPVYYDYGSNAVFQDNTMYLDGDPLASAADYANQAFAFANAGSSAVPPPTDQWDPLGVFGLVQGNEAMAQRIFQLAVDKSGIVRGNYYDAVADTNQPVTGKVDPKSQRVAWSVGERKDIVYEAGLNNLLQNEAPVLIHYGRERTIQMFLIRLQAPPGQTTPGAPPPTTPQPLAPPMK